MTITLGNSLLKTKQNKKQPTQIHFSRDYKNLDWDQLKASLFTNPALRNSTQLTDPSAICNTIQQTVQYHLDQQIPIRKIQITKKIPVFTTQSTRKLLIERDEALNEVKETNDPEAWRNFKNLRNRCHKSLTKDKKQYIQQKLDDKNNDRDKWEATKNILGWNTRTNPTILMDRGRTVTSPKQIAEALNHSLLSKVATLATVDPIENYLKKCGTSLILFKASQ